MSTKARTWWLLGGAFALLFVIALALIFQPKRTGTFGSWAYESLDSDEHPVQIHDLGFEVVIAKGSPPLRGSISETDRGTFLIELTGLRVKNPVECRLTFLGYMPTQSELKANGMVVRPIFSRWPWLPRSIEYWLSENILLD